FDGKNRHIITGMAICRIPMSPLRTPPVFPCVFLGGYHRFSPAAWVSSISSCCHQETCRRRRKEGSLQGSKAISRSSRLLVTLISQQYAIDAPPSSRRTSAAKVRISQVKHDDQDAFVAGRPSLQRTQTNSMKRKASVEKSKFMLTPST